MTSLKSIIENLIDVKRHKLLEIGAYDRPTFTKDEANIFSLMS